ncbi:hypothetical protein RSO01_72140 [Reyranella soli]|uniref:Uncharacterized protein n=2 Tax=Reyranella soli TaxID=1230389 RepID=A0A512NM67_9HYPH|nr:hypothetical protein RSO01_72140 [Reyranella soli]
MNFTLSSTLLGNLTSGGSGNGVYAYAFAFEGSSLIPGGAITLVDNGVATATTSIDLTTASDATFSSGRIFVVVQQTGAGGTSDLLTEITQVGDITSVDAQTRNYRFDLIEATLSGSASDVADISDIGEFGSTMTMEIVYGSGSATRGYNASGSTIENNVIGFSPAGSQNQSFETTSPSTVGPAPPSGIDYPANTPLNELRDLVMPGNNFPLSSQPGYTTNPIPASDWTAYANAFASWVTNSTLEIVTTFNGSSLQPQAALCDYTVQYDASTTSFWLVPTTSTAIQAVASTDYINIPLQSLIDNIYLQGGTLTVYSGSMTGPSTVYNTFTPNNAAGAVAKYFVAGFDAGFWGGTGNSVNPLDSSTLDLSQTWNWNANYAYNAILNPSIGYSNALGTGIGTATGQNRYYDPYAAEFFQNSNAYGYSYTDLISNGGGVSPAVSLWDSTITTPANVSTINITLYDLGETPPSSSFATGNTGYVAPTGSSYLAATTTSTNQLQFTFNFAIGSTVLAPDNSTPISFRFYAPGDPQAGSDNFVSLRLATGDWYYYTLNYDASAAPDQRWQLVPGNAGGQAGFFDIQNVPITADGSPAWYQLAYGDVTTLSTYNFYGTTTGGIFSSVIADHGVAVTNYGPGNVGLNMANGGSITYDPATFMPSTGALPPSEGPPNPFTPTQSPPTLPPPPAPAAPMVGSFAGSSFVAAGDLSALKHGDFAFSFNTAGGNYLLPGRIAKIELADTSHDDWIFTPLFTQANRHGDWTTGLGAELGNGTYSAVMKQYFASDLDLNNPVYTTSQAVTFTVNLDTLSLGSSADGHGLTLTQAGSATQGNWIELLNTGSTMPNATVVAYATDLNGNMLKRDGSGIATSIDDAALAKIGGVAADNGNAFFKGKQAVYLPVGDNLKFAVIAGNGQVDLNPDVHVRGSNGQLAVSIDDRFGHIDLSAQVNNTLDSSAVLAGAQRASDHPWVYLEKGTAVNVSLAWSGDFTNTLHFVRVDMNPANPGQWSVGGVAYGNTDAFRNAVQANWEFDSTHGHSTGTARETWTVQGESGYYAPVLVDPFGEIFTLDQSAGSIANADGRTHIRNFGANTFGFEDNTAQRGADFDYNDMTMKLALHDWFV